MSVTSLHEAYAMIDRVQDNLLRRAGELEQIQAGLEGFLSMVDDFYGSGELRGRAAEAVEKSKAATDQTNQARATTAELKAVVGSCLKLS